jgi:hypothetical protein
MYDYARKYVQSFDPNSETLPANEGDPCALCQQPLSADASTRIQRFAEFVNNQASKAADAAQLALRGEVAALLLGKVVERFNTDVRTRSLSGVVVDDEDYKQIFWAMKRVSERSGHDMAAARNVPVPRPDEMKVDLKVIDDYRIRVGKCDPTRLQAGGDHDFREADASAGPRTASSALLALEV